MENVNLFQMDLLPIIEPDGVSKYTLNLYIDGSCFSATISKSQVDIMKEIELVIKTKGMRHNLKGELEMFDYPKGVDGAGVEYTSKLYNLIEYKDGK